jgi:hypothetical protein
LPEKASWTGFTTVGYWLVKQFTISDVTFQNWMVLAIAAILVGIMLAWLSR